MVTRAPKQTAGTQIEFPAAWGTDVEAFTGRDLTEKKELIGVPFCILGIEVERNENRGYDVMYVTAMDTKGNEFEFSDTSTTGVKAQLQAAMVERKLNPAPGAGFQEMKMAVMRGLRTSEFEFTDEESGRVRDAKVFYLTATRVNRGK